MTYRTHHAAELNADLEGERVVVAGWIARRRDHGGIVFVDVRDASGMVQAVLDPETLPDAHELRMEDCVTVGGVLRRRPPGTENPSLPSGQVEIGADTLQVLSPAQTLPFVIDDRVEVDEVTRLKYRYLDLRRPRMARNLHARSRAVTAMRRTMEALGFVEVETPTLIASTPEGARDLLVPSRHRKGSFYALAQSPQLFKQLLMVAGVERYYQIARCYRDEDFRSDRQIEFSQLDLEGAFWGRDEVLEVLEEVTCAVVEAVRGRSIPRPFPRLTWREAIDRYGTDKPDLRFGMEIVDLTGVFEGTEFRAFRGADTVRGFNAGPIEASRSRLDRLVERAKELGAAGLVWMVVEEGGQVRSPVARVLTDGEIHGVTETLAAAPGDVLLLAAGPWRSTCEVLGQLRIELGRPESHEVLAPAFVVDFPTFEVDPAGRLVPSHHPFTAPIDVEEMEKNPEESLSQAYDLVLNGAELGSGSVRIHDPEVQARVFRILGIDEQEAQARFGWFLEALRYGTPPHAGFAFGVDRMVAILCDEPNIRQVIPFPKTQTGTDPLTGSPTPVSDEQLAELGLMLRPDPDDE